MAAGDLVTAEWQIEYNGVLLGDGTPYSLVQVQGLLDVPEVRTSDRTRLRRHGLQAGDDFLGGRTITVTVEVYSATASAFAADMETLLTGLSPAQSAGELPLVFRIPGVAGGGKRRVDARLRRREVPIDLQYLYQVPLVTLEFLATSPLLEDFTEASGISTLPSAGGGLVFPAVAPFTFGAVSTGGTITATNEGNFPASPSFRIDGPVVNPRLENLTSGKVLSMNITLAAGEYLLIDAEARTILLGGTSSRYSTLAVGSEWWDLEPGTSSVTFRASTSTAATLTMTWRSAWV